jgi:intracellular septation protein A
MTTSMDVVGAPVPPGAPRLRDVTVRIVMSLLVAVVVPTTLFWAAMVVFDVQVAMIIALAWMAAAMVWRAVTGRPVSPVLLLALGILTVKTTFTLVTGNTFVYFVQPVFADATVATMFLGSLLMARPMVARLAPDFYPMDITLAERPGMRRLFRRLTLLWGVVIIAKGTVTLTLLVTLSLVDFVLIKSAAIIALTLLAAATTVALAAVVGRQEGLLPARRTVTESSR